MQSSTGADKGTGAAVNDSCFGTDRLGYRYYAKAMYSMLSSSSPPICVGLFARLIFLRNILPEIIAHISLSTIDGVAANLS